MAKKLIKTRQILALVFLTIFANIGLGLPIASAAFWEQVDSKKVSADDGSTSHPVIPYLAPNFQLSPSQEESESKLIIAHGNFLVARNSPELPELKTSNNLKNPEVNIIKELIIPVTAYSSTPDQTDNTPFITAWGTYVRDGIVAANFLPFGTKIKIPELFGDKIFIVEDRMNKRYWHRIDVWFPEKQDAIEFGIKITKIQIIGS
jgi:3D (Asp-Asp-Asp) domain-containing protein